MATTICKLNKFGHCKFGPYCFFKHENVKCQDSSCDAKNCDLRHPKPCLYIRQSKPCKFEDACSFDHGVTSNSGSNETYFKSKINELEQMIEAKDLVISKLNEQISEIESQLPQNDTFTSVDEDPEISGSGLGESENEASTSQFSSQCLSYQCDCCDFKTLHEIGLKIHKTKKHKNKCDKCDVHFENKEQFERHMMSHKTLAYMHEHQSEEYSLEIRQYQNHESCLGVFNQTKPREDELPVLFLHSLECWKRLSHSCQDLPEPGYFENDDNVLVDYDQYDQTIHMLMDDLVDGDMNTKWLSMEWS